MCGVALHAAGGPRREVESYIEQAYNAYVKVREPHECLSDCYSIHVHITLVCLLRPLIMLY